MTDREKALKQKFDEKRELQNNAIPSNEADKNDSDIITFSNEITSYYSKPFNFSSNWLNEYTKTIFNSVTSGYLQIDIKAIQNIAYLMSYGGLAIKPFYILDICPSGVGKGTNADRQRSLLLDVVFRTQQEKAALDIEDYKDRVKNSKQKDREIIEQPKMHKCIHISDTSREALFESFESVTSQMVEFGELGLKLKKDNPVIDYICDTHGKNSIELPNYKNQRYKSVHRVEDVALFFYADTNLSYLGRNAFNLHLQGGLINRCLLVFDSYCPEYKELPSNYKISNDDKSKFVSISERIVKFSQKHSGFLISNSYTTNKKLLSFEEKIHNKKNDLIRDNNVYSNLYNRAIYNIRAIVEIFHYIRCFDEDKTIYEISEDTIIKAIDFISRYFNFDSVIEQLSNDNKTTIEKKIENKIIALGENGKLPMSFGEIKQQVRNSTIDTIKKVAIQIAYTKDSKVLRLIK